MRWGVYSSRKYGLEVAVEFSLLQGKRTSRDYRSLPANGFSWNLDKRLFMVALASMTLSICPSSAQTPLRFPPGYINDNSDWWSLYTGKPEAEIKPQRRVPAASNFQILGITLDHDEFKKVKARLGDAEVVGRGDASTGRSQLCYVSVDGPDEIHLIFEEGELDDTFYLFTGGSDWNGSDRCLQTKLISARLLTGSGMHLGQSRRGFEAILGRPSFSSTDRAVYMYEYSKKMTPEETKAQRQGVGIGGGEELFWYFSVHIEARFTDARLTYLAVSRTVSD